MDAPGRFASFGPWESLAAIRRWRALPGFQERVQRLEEVLDRFEPAALEPVAQHGERA